MGIRFNYLTMNSQGDIMSKKVLAAAIVLPMTLAGCASSNDNSIFYTESDSAFSSWQTCAAIGGVAGAIGGAASTTAHVADHALAYGAAGAATGALVCSVFGPGDELVVPAEITVTEVEPTPVQTTGEEVVEVAEEVEVGTPILKINLAGDTFFDFDSAELKPEMTATLDRLVAQIPQDAPVTAEITGHTDSTGDATYNQQLSEARAQAVADYIVAAGVKAEAVTVSGEGETNPVADNSTAEGREQNRRVVILINSAS